MPTPLQFFRAHPFIGTGTIAGSAITVGSYFLDAWHLFHIGLPYEALKGLGALLFFLSVIGFLYKWWSENLRVTTAQGAPSQASVSESNQAALPPVASSSASQQVLVPQDAYYLHDPAPGRGYPH